DEVKRRLMAEPGLAGVTFVERIPGFNQVSERIHIEGDPVPPDSAFDEAVRTLAVDLDFFDVMDARIVAGRSFTPTDLESDVGVVILGESFARRTLDGRNAVGQRIRFPDRGESEGNRWHQVVGVVQDPTMVAFGAGEYVGLYWPLAPGDEVSVQMYLHAPSNPQSLVPRIHSLITSVDPTLALAEFMPLGEIWEPVLRSDRFFLVVLTVVGTLALALSLAGIYALMSFTVAQRAREIAIRAALGARPRRIVAAIFSRALAQIGLGVVAGASLVSLTVIESGEGARLVAIVAALMFIVAMLACAVPTIRALRIHPAEVLKEA
ncbi:MAG: ABC transporter permease, partial [Longimicrobiales bacterium]